MSYHVCVAGHYLRVGREPWQKKSEIQIKQTPRDYAKTQRAALSIRNDTANCSSLRKQNLSQGREQMLNRVKYQIISQIK